MAILKCKMCGGNIEIVNGSTVGICNCCGTTTTLPKIDDDRLANLFNRANHFRMSGDFDKAVTAYEHILEEDDSIAEAHWGAVLSKFGIEYVEDPDSHKRIPTCHRTSWDSILRDVDYLDALKYAEPVARVVYEEEAKTIDGIQKGILSISKSEDPYDIFISYKNTTGDGNRTKDSVLAQRLYERLTEAGYRVFLSHITLEDKLGIQYEPYIFSALNAAKVMLVIGTSADNFNAVWVKNEWSRFFQLCKKDSNKYLFPCFRDMDPNDMPEELKGLQSQDMSKIGFEQDLLRGIEKIIGKNGKNESEKQSSTSSSDSTTAPLLERAFIFLEDGEWQRADDFCEQVLNKEPKNAQAYLGKLMAECRVHKQDELKDCREPFDRNGNYQKVIRFGSTALADSLKNDITYIRDRNETARKTAIYYQALEAMKTANSEEDYRAIAEQLESISGFNDADSFTKESAAKAEELRKEAVYNAAKETMGWETVEGYIEAINRFRTIPGWKDADELIFACQHNIEKIRAQEEEDRIAAERETKKIAAKAEADRLEAERRAQIEEKRERAATKRRTLIITPMIIVLFALIAIILNVQHHKCGDGVTWSYDRVSATLTISGNGDMQKPVGGFKKYMQAVVIEDGVTSICQEAFVDYDSLNSVTIPKSVTSISKNAFNCGRLNEIIVDANNENYTSVDNVLFNKDITELLRYPRGKSSDESGNSYSIPDGVTSICSYAFYRCDSLTAITIPDSVKSVGDDAFALCDSLNTVTLSDGITDIGRQAFWHCESLTSATIPNSITSIGYGAFEGCDNMAISYTGTMAEWEKFVSSFDGPVICSDGAIGDNDSFSLKKQIAIEANNLEVGDTWLFGSYEQDNNSVNGKEPIEWIVLDKQNDKMLVISLKCLVCNSIANMGGECSWAGSHIRSNFEYDNDGCDFFNDEEKECIILKRIPNPKNPEYGTTDGADTQDTLFLLSIDEVLTLFDNEILRKAQCTSFCYENTSIVVDGEGYCCWWLRTNGENGWSNAYIDNNGYINYAGAACTIATGIRPAMWIDITGSE